MPGRHQSRRLKQPTAGWTPLQAIPAAVFASQWGLVAKRSLVYQPLRQNLARKSYKMMTELQNKEAKPATRFNVSYLKYDKGKARGDRKT